MKHLAKFLIVAISLAIASALIFVWVRTDSRDLVISSAANGTYREVRAARDGWSFMTGTAWGKDSPRAWHWVANAPVFDKDLLALPDGEAFNMTSPTRGGVWPVTHFSGRGGTRFTSITFAGGTLIVNAPGNTLTGTGSVNVVTSRTMTFSTAVATTQNSGYVFTGSTTMPTITPPKVATPSLITGNSTITNNKDPLGLRWMNITLASPTTQPLSGTAMVGNVTISGGTLNFAPTYPFDRYVVPHWVVIVIVLLPALVVLLLVARRWRVKRWRERNGRCLSCGYDLRGGNEVCPECGTGSPATPVIAASV